MWNETGTKFQNLPAEWKDEGDIFGEWAFSRKCILPSSLCFFRFNFQTVHATNFKFKPFFLQNTIPKVMNDYGALSLLRLKLLAGSVKKFLKIDVLKIFLAVPNRENDSDREFATHQYKGGWGGSWRWHCQSLGDRWWGCRRSTWSFHPRTRDSGTRSGWDPSRIGCSCPRRPEKEDADGLIFCQKYMLNALQVEFISWTNTDRWIFRKRK